jgi:hypothetical protein
MTALNEVDRCRVIDGQPEDSHSWPAGEAIGPGVPCRFDASTGKAMIGNATSPTEAAIAGLNIAPKVTLVNATAHLYRKCLVALYDSSDANILAGLDYGDPVFLSATDGRFDDADPGENETVTATLDGSPTGGTFTLTFGGETTGNIAYDAAAATVEAELEALSSIGAGNIRVTGSAGGPYTLEFIGELANTNVGAVTADGSSLTGDGDEDVTIAVTNEGVESVQLGRVMPFWDSSTPTKVLAFEAPL